MKADLIRCAVCRSLIREMQELGVLGDDVPIEFAFVHTRAVGAGNLFWSSLDPRLREDFLRARRGELRTVVAARPDRARRGRALQRALIDSREPTS